MKTKTIAIIAALGLLPITGFAQTPPAPNAPNQPNQPIPPVPPVPSYKDKDKDKDRPKVPVTFLGVETSTVPRVLSEQLNLPKGFGLVVDYVVPDGPAAAAGVQQNDIIKMLNDQILMEPDQLAKLVRSYQEGTTVTLTILRKMAEQKITVKLGKKEVRQRHHDHDLGFNFDNEEWNQKMQVFNEKMKDFNEKMKDFKFDFQATDFGPDIRETVVNAQREAARATREAQREAARAMREAQRNARDQMRLFSRDKGAMKSTTIDLGKAVIVFTDEKGEMKIETVAGKKILTAKDPQGRLLFSGPVDNKEDLDKVPAEVRERYDKLEHKDLPAVVPNTFVENEDADNDNDGNDNASESDKEDDSDNDDPTTAASRVMVQQVSCPNYGRFVRNVNFLSI